MCCSLEVTPSPVPLKHWRFADGRRIVVYPEYKIRYFGAIGSDQWPILYRRDVPNLTHEEWIAPPGAGWTEDI